MSFSFLCLISVPRLSSLSKEDQAKLILTDLFGFDLAKDCLFQNDLVDDKKVNALFKLKWLPNSVYRLDLSSIEGFMSNANFQKIKTLLASKDPSTICDKCHRKLNKPKTCDNCLKQFHEKCFGPHGICFSCNTIIETGIYLSAIQYS